MPYREPEPGDPHELVGVSVPADLESMRAMAYTFAEEFATLGFSEARLLNLFRQPFYAGAHRAWRALGEAEIRRIVAESLEVWGRFRVVVKERPAQATGPRLVQIGGKASRPPETEG